MAQYEADLGDLQAWARAKMHQLPDYVIGDDPDRPYMRRWWIMPRNPFCNVYLHEILRSDDDRAGHDHPWDNRTLVIEGEYDEVTFLVDKPWIEAGTIRRQPGDIVERYAETTHRLIIPEGGRAVSLFITGPRLRDWGFWCPGDGERPPRWVDFREFLNAADRGKVGKGCGE